MKEFFKYVAATVVGIIIFLIVAGIFGMMSIVGMIASGQATQTVEDGSVLVLNLSGSIASKDRTTSLASLLATTPLLLA